jgi:hypothetical protein
MLHRYPVQHGMRIVPQVSGMYFAFFVQEREWLSGDRAERRHSVMLILHGLVCALDSFNVA